MRTYGRSLNAVDLNQDGNPDLACISESNVGGSVLLNSRPSLVAVPGPPAPVIALSARVWPTPARGDLTIALTLPHKAAASVRVFDLSGRKVDTVAVGEFDAGRHEVHWARRGVRAGMYFVEVRATGARVTRRVVLLD